MKKLISVLLAVCMILCLSACNVEVDNGQNDTLDSILALITDEVSLACEKIKDSSDTITLNMGDTINGYMDHKDEIYSFYDEIEADSTKLFLRIESLSLEYFENVATDISADEEQLDITMREYYNVCDEAMSDFHDVSFDTALNMYNYSCDLLRAEFFNDQVDADTYFKEIEEIEKAFETIESVIFELNSSAHDKTFDNFYIVYNGLLSGKNDVNDILEDEAYKPTTEEG